MKGYPMRGEVDVSLKVRLSLRLATADKLTYDNDDAPEQGSSRLCNKPFRLITFHQGCDIAKLFANRIEFFLVRRLFPLPTILIPIADLGVLIVAMSACSVVFPCLQIAL